jgi:hypothetical protein
MDDNTAKRGTSSVVTSCSYNASSGYIVYTYGDAPTPRLGSAD